MVVCLTLHHAKEKNRCNIYVDVTVDHKPCVTNGAPDVLATVVRLAVSLQ